MDNLEVTSGDIVDVLIDVLESSEYNEQDGKKVLFYRVNENTFAIKLPNNQEFNIVVCRAWHKE